MNRMQAKMILNNQDGSVIVLALILLVLLTLMGLSTISTSTIEVKIADNEKRHKLVLYAADAGIEAGRAALDTLKDADTGNWDNLFQGNQLVGLMPAMAAVSARLFSPWRWLITSTWTGNQLSIRTTL